MAPAADDKVAAVAAAVNGASMAAEGLAPKTDALRAMAPAAGAKSKTESAAPHGGHASAAAAKNAAANGAGEGEQLRPTTLTPRNKKEGMHHVSENNNTGGGKLEVLTQQRRRSAEENDSPTSTSSPQSPPLRGGGSKNNSFNRGHAGGATANKPPPGESLRRRQQPVTSPHSAEGGLRNKAVAHARPRARRNSGEEAPPADEREDHHELPCVEKSEGDMELIMRAYAACSLFDELPGSGVPRKLALAMSEVLVKPNADIVKQGTSTDDSFYIVVEGKVSVLQRPDLRLDAGADLTEFTKNLHKRSDSDMSLGSTKDVKASWKESKGSKKAEGGIFDQQPGHERFIRALGPGEYFGEVSLIYDTERTATVRSQSAGGACRVFQLRRQHYVMAQAAAQEALSRERRKLVSGVALLKGLETELLHRVVDMLEAETKRAGELIFEKGEFGDKLYIVESGEVSIVIDGKEVRRFHAGDYFGEVALLNENSTRTANALVAEGSATARLLSVQRDNFESILGPLKVAMHSSALAQIPFFAPLSPDQISDLAQCLQLRKFTAGATVIKAGEVDDAIYLVAQGSLEEESNAQFKRSLFPAGSLRRQAAVNNSGSSLPPTPGSSADGVSPGGTVFRRVLNKGDYFGEAALLTQEPGGLTVRSLDLSSILSLSKVDIQKKVGSLVQLQQAWRRNAVEAWAKQAKETLANDGVNIAVSSADIDVIIEELEVKCCKAGEVLADGDASPAGCFVGVVMSGCVAVVSKLYRGGEGYSAKKLNALAGGDSFNAKQRSRRAGMERKRLITEGPVDLPQKSETASRLFGDEGRAAGAGADGGSKVDIKVVAAAAAVLLVPPADPSPELLRALATLDDHAVQNAGGSTGGSRRGSGGSESSAAAAAAASAAATGDIRDMLDKATVVRSGSGRHVIPPPPHHLAADAAIAPLPGSINDDAAAHSQQPTTPRGGGSSRGGSRRGSNESGGGGGESSKTFGTPSRPGSGKNVRLSRQRQESNGSRDAHVLHRSDLRGAIKIDPRSLKIIKAVGKGGFSRVFHVSCDARRSGEPKTRREFALKVIPIRHLVKNKVEHTVRHERDVMGSIQHPAIIRLYSAFKAHDHIYFVTDLVNGLDFYWCMQNFEISEKGAKFYMSQVVLMLEYLHSRTIAYRDIKPENLIIARDGYLRMIDFGLSKFLGPGERSYTFCGTPLYLAPEVWGSGGHNRAVDFWALGVLFFEVTSGSLPWDAKTEVELRTKVVNGSLKFPPGAVHGQDFSPQLKQFIAGLLEKNPNKRLGMLKEGIQGIKRAAWLREIDWKGLEGRTLEPPFRPEQDVNPEMAERVRVDEADRQLVPPTSRECPKYGEYFPDF